MSNTKITKEELVKKTNDLVEKFREEYEKKHGKFLLFELAHANENANTRVLLYLLKDKGFLDSFIERVGLPKLRHKDNVSFIISDQKNAIGNKGKGFIDLFIKYDDVKVIIENKIFGAGDTRYQLARYIATLSNIDEKDFESWRKQPAPNVDPNTHVVYLTADRSKEPSDDSLPENVKKQIEARYYPINYSDDILPWLEEDVLPKIPYGEDGGMTIAGMRQYIAFLKQLLSNEKKSDVIDKYVKDIHEEDSKKYKILQDAIKYLDKIEKQQRKQSEDQENIIPDNILASLRKQLGNCAEAIFSGDVEGEWVLHFTPSFILLYKKSWAALDTRKYSIPSLYLYAGSTDYFLKNKCLSTLTLGVDHLSPSMKVKFLDLKFGNHDKSVAFELLKKPYNIKCSDINNQDARKDFYKDVVKKVQPVVEAIDNDVVSALLASDTPVTPDKILEEVVTAYQEGSLNPQD